MSPDRREDEVSKQIKDVYFKHCPLCHSSDSIAIRYGFLARSPTFTCSGCKAKWRFDVNWGTMFSDVANLGWVMLIEDGVDGRGVNLINERHRPEFWQKMSLKDKPQLTDKPQALQLIKEKEIIREKEVIVKVRCPYCRKLHDETDNRCPYCGG